MSIVDKLFKEAYDFLGGNTVEKEELQDKLVKKNKQYEEAVQIINDLSNEVERLRRELEYLRSNRY